MSIFHDYILNSLLLGVSIGEAVTRNVESSLMPSLFRQKLLAVNIYWNLNDAMTTYFIAVYTNIYTQRFSQYLGDVVYPCCSPHYYEVNIKRSQKKSLFS